MTAPDPPPQRLRWTGGAIALVVIGFVILIPSGLCTAIVGVPSLARATGETFVTLLGALVFGGPFIALGIGFIVTGFRSRVRK